MSSAVVKFESWQRLLPLLVLLLAGCLVRPLEARLAAPFVAPAASPGGIGAVGVLSGFRAAVAGFFWLRANLAWEQRDAAATRALVELSLAADERPLYFWLNGARMMAYDFPTWSQEDRPAAVRRQAQVAAATMALTFLDEGLRRRGRAPELLIEMANIRLRAMGDREGAARLFREAAELPGAPYYAARIHAELLCALGRPGEALAWLHRVLPTLPADEPAARRAVVEQRIKELEAMAGVR
jgi:hypothetical protein